MANRYYKKLIGERVYLSPMNAEDSQQYTEWFNDLETTQYLHARHWMVNEAGERSFLENKKGKHAYTIVSAEDDTPLGNVGLHNIDQLNGMAMAGIFIGDKAQRGQGYGYEALGLLIWYGFKVLGLGNIILNYFSYNQRGAKLYAKLGFQPMGTRRKCVFWNGKYHDLVYMDLLEEELTYTPPQRFLDKLEG
jgi:RimJ/RimL family protein N-acetyltransferase